MRRAIPLTLAAALSLSLLPRASAAPSVAEIQRQVNDLREEAASKYEAANAVKYQISKLQRQLNGLKQGEAAANAKATALQSEISKIGRAHV